MTALANTKIYYIIGDSVTNDFSKEYVFNVPPAKVRRATVQCVWISTPAAPKSRPHEPHDVAQLDKVDWDCPTHVSYCTLSHPSSTHLITAGHPTTHQRNPCALVRRFRQRRHGRCLHLVWVRQTRYSTHCRNCPSQPSFLYFML